MNSTLTTGRLSHYILPFFTLSHPTDTPIKPDSFFDSAYYTTGRQDVCIIVTCIAVMAILRDAFRLCVFEPLARWKLTRDLMHRKRLQAAANGSAAGKTHTNGHANGSPKGLAADPRPTPKELRQIHRSVLRFAEQGWSVVYYPLQWCYGLYVHRNLPTRVLHPVDLWHGYPHIPLAGPLKFYYLLQTAFYIHQILILNAEARRKDHVQMMTHHVITVLLMATSYYANYTRIGCLIMVLMDWCDIWLPLAKMLRYIGYQFLCDVTFGFFMVSWLVTRHALFILTIISTFKDCPKIVPFIYAPEEGRYLNNTIFWSFCSLLIALQILQIIWSGMICRIAWRVLTTDNGASDDRSDESDVEQKED